MNDPTDSVAATAGDTPGGRARRAAQAGGIALAHSIRPSLRSRRFDPLYSRYVAVLKVALPVLALALILLVAVWPSLQEENISLRLGFAALDVGGSEEPSMVNPRYTGIDSENEPFTVTADLARNLVPDTERVELEMPKADMTLDDGTWLVVTSERGVYTRADDMLDLAGSVTVFHDTGYELRTEAAVLDLEAGTVVSKTPVAAQGPFGNLESEGMRVIDKGRVIHFTGDAHMVLYPGADGSVN